MPASDLIGVSTGALDALAAGPGLAALRAHGKLRNLGAQALHLCAVAGGDLAACLSVEARLWDEAAAGLIAREAGAVYATDPAPADWTDPAALMALPRLRSLAAHPALAPALAPLIHA